MQSQRKRPIEDFFTCHSQTTQTIPRKRPHPPSASNEQQTENYPKVAPRTPSKPAAFKDVSLCSVKSPLFSPGSHHSLPIRSPNPSTTASPSKIYRGTQREGAERPLVGDSRHVTSFVTSEVSERGQSIIEDGKVIAVRDSDDDSESLESLSEIFGKRDAAAESDSSPPEDAEAERLQVLKLFTSGKSRSMLAKDRLKALLAREQMVKFDLSLVLDDHFGDEEAQQNIAEMRANYDGAHEGQQDTHFDKDLLVAVVQTGNAADDEDVERLLNAVERTEALSTERKFSFFDADRRLRARHDRKNVFPASAIPSQMWMPKNISAQNRAYISGYMTEAAAEGRLVDAALKWTFMQVTKENRADIRSAYIECLRAGSASWTWMNVTAEDVHNLFLGLGASPQCLRDASSIEPCYQPLRDQPPSDYGRLLSALQMFQALCSDMDFVALSKLSSIVLRLALDVSVMSNNRVCAVVENLIGTLLSLTDQEIQNHVYDRLLSDAVEHLHDPRLQAQLLRHIIPNTTRAAELRKILADTFLLGPSALHKGSQKRTSSVDLETLTKYVSTSSSFSVTRHTNSTAIDYAALKSHTEILNVAIAGVCLSPPAKAAITPGSSVSASTSTSISLSASIFTDKTPPTSQALLSSHESNNTPDSAQETLFNHQVDVLADTLHKIFVSIKDTGASHMRRTEAKDALQALYYRLLFSVRTRPRKKKHVFDPSGGGGGRKGVGSTLIKASNNSHGRWLSGEEWREREKEGEFMRRFLTTKNSS